MASLKSWNGDWAALVAKGNEAPNFDSATKWTGAGWAVGIALTAVGAVALIVARAIG